MIMKFFKELPGTKRNKWMVIGDELRAHPGLWGEATVTSRGSVYATAANITGGRYQLGPGQFEATVRRIDADKYAVYVRLVPEAK
jgi:hypothetical protein